MDVVQALDCGLIRFTIIISNSIILIVGVVSKHNFEHILDLLQSHFSSHAACMKAMQELQYYLHH